MLCTLSSAGVAVALGTRRCQWTGRTLLWLLNNLYNKATTRADNGKQIEHGVITLYVNG